MLLAKFGCSVVVVTYQSEPNIGLHNLVLLIHIDELYESQSERHLHLLGHVLHGANELVVTPKQVPNQTFLLL